MSLFKRPKIDTAYGIYLQSVTEQGVRELRQALLDLVQCRASDKVKIAALDVIKSKLSQPITITGCNIKMGI